MSKFLVTITETLSRTVLVEADCKEDAEKQVEHAYNQNDIILDADDFSDKEFNTRKVTNEDLSLYEKL